METNIVEYKTFYIVKHKDGRTRELPDEFWKKTQQDRVTKNKQCVLLLGDDAIDGYDICEISKHKPASDIESYILSQPKDIRDKLKSLNKVFNSIEHVSNHIEAINKGEF